MLNEPQGSKPMIVKMVREGLGRLFIFISNLTLPEQQQRDPRQQAAVDAATQKLTMYQFYACPFCLKVRRHVYRLNLKMGYADAQNNPVDRQALQQQGGKIQVPCLRIEENNQVSWLYESDAIISYLNQHFSMNSEHAIES